MAPASLLPPEYPRRAFLGKERVVFVRGVTDCRRRRASELAAYGGSDGRLGEMSLPVGTGIPWAHFEAAVFLSLASALVFQLELSLLKVMVLPRSSSLSQLMPVFLK